MCNSAENIFKRNVRTELWILIKFNCLTAATRDLPCIEPLTCKL